MSVVTESEILRAVLIDPYDVGPRWIYADWLDEHGQPERAEFIRVDLQIANRPPESEFVQLLHRRSQLIQHMNANGIEWSWRDHGEGDFISAKTNLGLVEEIELTLQLFKRYAKEVFSRFPIRKVKLSDRRPSSIDEIRWVWDTWDVAVPNRIDEPHLLPRGLLYAFDNIRNERETPHPNLIEKFSTPERANEWLSSACLHVGRKLARLPQIEKFDVL